MFFKNYLTSLADTIQSKYEGMQRDKMNPSDKGEICEVFIKEFLDDFFSDIFNIYRGGKIFNIQNEESTQLDIIITSKYSLKIFKNKGYYPIESVFGVFSITSHLDYPKLMNCINEFMKIPKSYLFMNMAHNIQIKPEIVYEFWYRIAPYKCVFAFSGDINTNWIKTLNQICNDNEDYIYFLPDIIAVNKKGLIRKIIAENSMCNVKFSGFEYIDLTNSNSGVLYTLILNELYTLSSWQNVISPAFSVYFDKDLNS